ncbi:hypothetical protein EI94DRAFT_1024060 [Lactarius quietus]|nr:hypothetical protein EI94DRAFT_1024060 [Lactarius quietus]
MRYTNSPRSPQPRNRILPTYYLLMHTQEPKAVRDAPTTLWALPPSLSETVTVKHPVRRPRLLIANMGPEPNLRVCHALHCGNTQPSYICICYRHHRGRPPELSYSGVPLPSLVGSRTRWVRRLCLNVERKPCRRVSIIKLILVHWPPNF